MSSHIGARLRAARERRGLSREALAFHSGVSWSAIAQIESGRRTQLRPSTLSSLADAVGVTIDYLVHGRAATALMLEHRALLYETATEFYAAATEYLAQAVERGEAALAVLSSGHSAGLRERLGPAAEQVEFAEQSAWYANPAQALDRYRRFLESASRQGTHWVRILGDCTQAGCPADEARAWARYESLINLAFSGAPVTILCPYDAAELHPSVIEQARFTHPQVLERGELSASPHYADPGGVVLGE